MTIQHVSIKTLDVVLFIDSLIVTNSWNSELEVSLKQLEYI